MVGEIVGFSSSMFIISSLGIIINSIKICVYEIFVFFYTKVIAVPNNLTVYKKEHSQINWNSELKRIKIYKFLT